MGLIEFELYGCNVTFNHKAKVDEFFFTVSDGSGFYPNNKTFTSVWGRPYKKNYKEIAEHYINTSEGRVSALKAHCKNNQS